MAIMLNRLISQGGEPHAVLLVNGMPEMILAGLSPFRFSAMVCYT
jgi:hypothetical protein